MDRDTIPWNTFEHLADGMGVRDALNRLDSELLAPRPLGEISRILTDRKAAEIEQEAKKVNGFELLVDDAAAVRYGRQLRAHQLAASQA
jgi:hypothetical protein